VLERIQETADFADTRG